MSLLNLERDPNANYILKRELERCRIPAEEAEAPSSSPVRYNFIGRLGDIEFIRKSDCWQVKCKIPVEMAEKIAEDPLRYDLWPNGHAATPPEQVAVWLMPDDTEARPPGRDDAKRFITSYTVFSETALRFLADMIKELELAEELAPA